MPKPLKKIAKTKTADDLFGAPEPKGRGALKVASRNSGAEADYTARDIEVLEGLEPVRRRPGMYIGGTDEKALHHLFAEVIDNSMDEALAGHATFIEVELGADGFLTVTDNGRGIPVDPHPKFPKKSALEVIMCTLHAGGKFDSKVYETSGRPARRRRVGGERAVLAAGSRGRARPKALRHGVRARSSQGQARRSRQDQQPPRHQDPLQAGRRDFRRQGRLQAAAAVQDGALEGLSVRRRGNSLALRAGIAQGHRGRSRRGQLPLSRGPEGLSRRRDPRRYPGASGYLFRQVGTQRRAWRLRMGGGLDRRRRRLSVLLLQHHSDARMAAPTNRVCAARCCGA